MEKQTSGGTNGDQVLSQAQSIWTMLDQLAENNPSAYKKFIEQQLTSGREHASNYVTEHSVEPALIIRSPARFNKEDQSELFNLKLCILKSSRIPPPKSKVDPVQIYCGALITLSSQSERFVALALNPSLVEEELRPPVRLEDELVELCLRCCEQNLSLRIDRSHAVLSIPTAISRAFPSSSPPLVIPFSGSSANPNQKTLDTDLEALSTLSQRSIRERETGAQPKQQAPAQSSSDPLANTNSLLDRLRIANSHDEQADIQPSSPISLTPERPNERSSSKGGKKLIEEVDSSGSRASASASASAPEYKLELRGGERSGGEQETHYLLSVHLPHIASASECELDATENNIELRTRGDYEQYLHVRLERKITSDDVNAKYNKKTHTLVIRMPLYNSNDNLSTSDKSQSL